ncbi:post-GPI attachment to proteins factor 6 [Bombina bombina]|uniref:post-GPI attachment to proteins factor 6 n=1 Tax=Bombina bombina TaxID=8345 RepID=UPI00235AC12B|nr:post-GPI attachment to proteins factor 6 [Bombina bombina]XP_053563978.1 post-GPI attachment to proteins factor 6 [Bombina bombina]
MALYKDFLLLELLIFIGLFCYFSPVECSSNDVTYVSEFYSQSAQPLSFYNWYGNVRLFHFQVPMDTVLLRWLLQVSRGKAPECANVEITVYFRYGAPPVINPLDYNFAPNTSVHPSFNKTIKITNSLQNITLFNITNPTPGDWFIAAHLPKATEKIEIQGFTRSCTYILQPDLFILREVEIPILKMDSPTLHTITNNKNHANFKVFIPEYTFNLKLQVQCTNSTELMCPLQVTVGSFSLPQSFQQTINCSERTECKLHLFSPPWDKWLRVIVEFPSWINITKSFEVMYTLSVCKPGTVGSRSFFTFLNMQNSTTNYTAVRNSKLFDTNLTTTPGTQTNGSNDSCLRKYPVIREYLDVFSIRFLSVNGPAVLVSAGLPTIMLFNLNSNMESGGMLVVSLQLNKTSLNNVNATVIACLSAASPVLTLNTTNSCSTAFFQGYPLIMNSSVTHSTQNIPYPEIDNWYLSLQLLCPEYASDCQAITPRVTVSTYLSPCLDDCGTYGECRLLRRNGYLYAACSCKSGWAGWSCTDAREAYSFGHQLMATLLLTLSNFMFLPTIIVSVYRFYFVEAAVYTFTMFFSTFYHACDQPGVAVMCIMDYDTLQYCDFLGSVVSIWVTILCMSRLRKYLKYVLFILGTLFIAMSMQLDRRGLWNMMGPCLFALIILVIAWTYRGVKRHSCYPPNWKRWVFFLIPGISLAVIAISVYVFTETNQNYFYTHSLWHIMVAGSVAFLLPPREKNKKPWTCTNILNCKYKMCEEDRKELYSVTQ